MHLLVVEDEHKIATSLKKGLEQEKHVVDVAYDGLTGLDLASSAVHDLIILDLMLPDMDGLTICKKLRESGVHTPILMLTAKDSVQDKVLGLNTGADDYLAKPFAFSELLARLQALARRPRTTLKQTLKIGDLALDPVSSTVTKLGIELTLSKKEYVLLEYLMRHPDRTFSKEQLIESLWPYDSNVLPNTVEVYVGYLRTKIGNSYIKTIRGFGYKLSTK